MKITWLGQAGLLLETGSFTIMVDPYLSDSVGTLNPKKHRKVPVDPRFFEIEPDLMIFTHDHLDHYDPETVSQFLSADSGITILAPTSVFEKVRTFGDSHNYVCFNRHSSWTEGGILFRAIRAEHSDPYAIGVLISDSEHTFYITGDTLYNEDIFPDLPSDIYAAFLPVNGVGNNMNFADAVRFLKRIRPKFAVPFHCGLFDEQNLFDFPYENKVVPTIYEEVQIP